MTYALNNKEIIELATILETFNDVSHAALGQEEGIMEQIVDAMSEEQKQKMTEAFSTMLSLGFATMFEGESEENTVAVAFQNMVIFDLMAQSLEKVGMQEKFAAFVPAQDKAENTEKFRKLGMNGIANLWMK